MELALCRALPHFTLRQVFLHRLGRQEPMVDTPVLTGGSCVDPLRPSANVSYVASKATPGCD